MPPVDADDEAAQDIDPVVRPFIVTGGRTRPTDERLRVETLVGATPAALSAPLGFERRRIVELCQRPRSVAEIANGLGVPIGVTRVLIADLVAERLVTAHDHVGPAEHISLYPCTLTPIPPGRPRPRPPARSRRPSPRRSSSRGASPSARRRSSAPSPRSSR
jgi:hypothetical protein